MVRQEVGQWLGPDVVTECAKCRFLYFTYVLPAGPISTSFFQYKTKSKFMTVC